MSASTNIAQRVFTDPRVIAEIPPTNTLLIHYAITKDPQTIRLIPPTPHWCELATRLDASTLDYCVNYLSLPSIQRAVRKLESNEAVMRLGAWRNKDPSVMRYLTITDPLVAARGPLWLREYPFTSAEYLEMMSHNLKVFHNVPFELYTHEMVNMVLRGGVIDISLLLVRRADLVTPQLVLELAGYLSATEYDALPRAIFASGQFMWDALSEDPNLITNALTINTQLDLGFDPVELVDWVLEIAPELVSEVPAEFISLEAVHNLIAEGYESSLPLAVLWREDVAAMLAGEPVFTPDIEPWG